MNKLKKRSAGILSTNVICATKSYIKRSYHFLSFFSIGLIFILSGCMENNNNFNYLIAGAAGGTVASVVGYAAMSTPSISKIAQAKNKIACCCSR